MRQKRQFITFVASFFAIAVFYLVYDQTVGQLTDFEQLSDELARPMVEEVVGEPDPAMLRESELAAIRGFGPDCPELNAPLKFESRKKSEAELVLHRGIGMYVYAHDYEVLKENPRLIRFHPFSMVHVESSKTGKGEEDEISTVRAQEAVLEFDRPIELTKMTAVKPIAGWVRGRVEMKTNRGTDDPNDDIVVLTERLDYREAKNLIWSEGQIRVVQNEAQITGRGMELELLDERKGTRKNRPAARRLRLFQDVSFFLFLTAEENFLGPPAAPVSPAVDPGKKEKAKATTPLRVTSRGPFTFDLEKNQATFQQSVRVLRRNPPKPPGEEETVDQLECDHLLLDFQENLGAGTKRPGGPDANQGSLRLKAATATGTQVLLLSDSENLQATGTYLRHDTLARRAFLKSDHELVVLQNNTMLHGRSLVIEQGDGSQVRSLVADGPNGWLELVPEEGGKSKTDGGRLKIRWQGRLTMTGKAGSDTQVVTITDKVELEEERGAMKSDQLKVWLVGVDRGPAPALPPGTKGRGRKVEPIKIEALGNVSAKFDNLAVVTETLLMDIVRRQEVAQPAGAPLAPPPAPTAGVATAAPKKEDRTPIPPARPSKPPETGKGTPVLKNATARGDARESEPLDVRAKRVAIVVERQGEESRPVKAWAEGDVVVTQPNLKQNSSPVEVRGHTLDFQRAPLGDVLKVGSSPDHLAVLKTPDMTLAGKLVRMNEIKNSLDVAGAGYLIRQSQSDLTGKQVTQPQLLRVDWEKSMNFDGKVANFMGGVKAQQGTAEMHAENMDVTFDQRIVFRQMRQARERRPRSESRIEAVDCSREVYIYDGERKDGLFVRHVTTHVPELHIDNLARVAEAKGPGTVQIIEKNESKSPSPDPGAATHPFQHTSVRFQGAMRADQTTKTIKFYDQVHILHSPVDRLDDAIDESRPSPEAMVLDARDAAIVQVREFADGRKFRDFQAAGDVKIHSRDYWGQGDGLSFDQEKNLIVFNGSPEQKAALYRQGAVGDRPEEYSARTIKYWRGLNRVVIDSAEGFQTILSPDSKSPLPGPAPERTPPKRPSRPR